MDSDHKFGIVQLTVIPVRSSPDDTAEICTQLLFGDLLEVIEDKAHNWVRVKCVFDNYVGWVDPKQITFISKELFLTYQYAPRVFALDIVYALSLRDDSYRLLTLGSFLPFLKGKEMEIDGDMVKYDGKHGSYDVAELTTLALQFLGTPYLWGGKSVMGIDCSGLVQQVFRMCGIFLPRDASEQEGEGDEIKYKDAKAGDLAFFANKSGKVIHVGILLTGHQIIHAHGQVKISVLDEKGIQDDSEKGYSHYLHSLRRCI